MTVKVRAGLPNPDMDVPLSYGMPSPFPVTEAKTRRKPVGHQASQTKWITGGGSHVHRPGGSRADPGGLCGAVS